jgi:hypothetical protein
MIRSIRQKARRYGWTDQMLNRHYRIWHRCVREIRRKLDGGDLDLAEIERLLGA